MGEGRNDTDAPRVLRMKQVQERLGLARSTIYDRMNVRSPRYDCTFPKPIKLGGAAVGWIESEINAWIDSRVVAGLLCSRSVSICIGVCSAAKAGRQIIEAGMAEQ